MDDFLESEEFPFHYVKFLVPGDDATNKNTEKLKYYISGYAAKLIRAILSFNGFTETRNQDAALLIVGSVIEDGNERRLTPNQRHNHFMQTFSLGSKSGYHQLMSKLKKYTGIQPSFYPESFQLPNQKAELKAVFDSSPLWIQKPSGGSRGNGIKVISKLPSIATSNVIVQRYVSNPLLIHGLKFDLRFYVAVTAIDPLKIYIFDNGLVRLATAPYEENLDKPENQAAHLTNFSINKNEKDFVVTNDISKDGTGNKWSHAPFWPFLESVGFDVPAIKKKIEDAFVQIIIAAHPTFKQQNNHRVSFELFGFDVMIDKDQEITVLEINVSPALGTSSELDKYIKTPLVRDLFNIALVPYPSIHNDIIYDIMTKKNQKEMKNFVSCVEYEIAQRRLGGFTCIYPTIERCDNYQPIFKSKSANDDFLHKWISYDEETKLRLMNEGLLQYNELVNNK